jgi:LPXTG-site transpeptidase (sortase) family protein
MNPLPRHISAERPPKRVFLAATLVIFFLSLSAADSVGLVPCYVDGTECSRSVALRDLPELGEELVAVQGVLPERISIPAIDLELPVQNTPSRDLGVLEEALKDGPVRYMDSALLGERGNMLVFAHSSNLPIVRNQMYKAFNRIHELSAGDIITVSGEGKQYLYSVTSVRQTDANEEIIDLSPSQGTKLTLSTCDTLTSKTSRFVVEADFVGVLLRGTKNAASAAFFVPLRA